MHASHSSQHDPDTCDSCCHARIAANNVARDRLAEYAQAQQNDPTLAAQWNQHRADQKTGKLYDDTQ
jgi:hypothetical protein